MAAAIVWSPAGAFSGEMPERLIAQSVDERDLLTLSGNTRPEAVALNDRGAVSDALNLGHIYLQMNRSPARENAPAELVEKLHDFTGSAGAVREAFHTEIHNLNVSGQARIGNVSNPKIPAALAPAVRYCGVDVCQKFHRRPGRNTRFTAICAPSYDLH